MAAWFKKILIIVLAGLSFFLAPAQENGPKEKSIKSERKVRRELRAEAKEKRRKEKAERKAIKQYHKRLQTKQVRKRMKVSRKKAIRHNENKREFFVKRWFKKKKKV